MSVSQSSPGTGTVETPAAPANAIGMKHVCFATPDVDAALAGLQRAGLVAAGPEIVVTPFGTRLVFVTDPDGVSVELLQEEARS